MKASELRASILQEAVSGRLVPQDPSEGTAEDLLKEIAKEREALIKAGKIKKEKPLPEITEDEIPFEIPKTWKWVRITEIARCELGKTKDSGRNTGDYYDYLCSINVYEGNIDLSNVKQMQFEPEEFERYSIKKGDLLVCEGGDAGRCAVWNKDSTIFYQNALHRVRFYGNINPYFYMYVMHFYKANNILSSASTGMTIQHFTLNAFRMLFFPLPPLSEQKRIVAKIEELKPLIDAYGKEEEKLSLISSKFPGDIRKSILQEAVSGRLVPQISSEGTAEDLLKEIAKEREALVKEGKIKKEKPQTEITEDEIPFEIPKTWKWVRLGDVVPIIMGQSPDGNKVGKFNDGIEFHQGKIYFSKKYLLESDVKTLDSTKIVPSETVLLSVRAPIGFVNITNRRICIGRGLCGIPPTSTVNKEYFFFVLQTLQKEFEKKGTGSTFKAISHDIIKNQPFPLPPLAEQKRIVDKIENLMKIIEKNQF